MRKYLLYLWYVVRHKYHVLVAGRATGAPLWRLLVHDLSKLTPSEFVPYARFFYGDGSHEDFHSAFLKHWHRNPHHWEHWVRVKAGGRVQAVEMPLDLVREMVADWVGAGKAKRGDGLPLREWYEGADIVLHRETRRAAEVYMELFS